MDKSLSAPIQYLKGIGPKKSKSFNKIGVYTIEDLIYFFPRRYEDRTHFCQIAKLEEGLVQTIKAKVLDSKDRHSWRRRRFSILEVAVDDNTGKLSCVWFNQPYLKNYFKPGMELILFGKVERYGAQLQMNSPEFEIISAEEPEHLSIGRIVPIYSLPQEISQRTFRSFVKETLDEFLPQVNDFLSFDVRSRNNLLNLAKSLLEIHYPESPGSQLQAHTRLSFEEFFIFQVLLALRKSSKNKKLGIAHKISNSQINDFIKTLPFRLTKAQVEVTREIVLDMASKQPMQRLLQGDVGSGKTIVAVIASVIAMQGGYQVAFMVPTEVLAKQHFEKISRQLSAFSSGQKINIGILTSSLTKKEKDVILKNIEAGKIDLIIGTHALLQESVKFRKLGLVVIDEQHKFGVGQRALLPQRDVSALGYPDVLIMTATPIPRTLSITLYGDLDVSVINELPPGRQPIKTMHFDTRNREKAYALAKEQLVKGQQVFIIYPVIEQSYALDIAGAKKMYEKLKGSEFSRFKVGLIHGRLKQDEQDEVMLKFKNKEIDLLISTTVLEVGIDIANATCMIIEYAERFGLSQLHQLRGRVGRGPLESYCVLVSDSPTEESRARIAAMVKHTDGFLIAEEDLRIRGPGEFFGLRQSGLSELKIANPLTQLQLLKKAREEAINIVKSDSQLGEKQNILLKQKLLSRFPEYEKLVVVG